jgi:hypothetical protein
MGADAALDASTGDGDGGAPYKLHLELVSGVQKAGKA